VERYADLALGLADAPLVELAGRFKTRRILTFDERTSRVVAPPRGSAFTILRAERR